MTLAKQRSKAWHPARYDVAEIDAIKALAAGAANAAQQGIALRWLLHAVCEVDDEQFRSDEDGGERETAYALGKRSVGRQVQKLIHMSPAVVAQMREKNA